MAQTIKKAKSKYLHKDVAVISNTADAWCKPIKLTKHQQEIVEAEERGHRTAVERFRRELEDKKESERKKILDTKIKVLDAAGQLMQQMSTLVEGVWHILKETDNAQHS